MRVRRRMETPELMPAYRAPGRYATAVSRSNDQPRKSADRNDTTSTEAKQDTTRKSHVCVLLQLITHSEAECGNRSFEGNWILAKRIQAADCYERKCAGDGLWVRSCVHGGSES